ncbi:MAG TPA: hypothetical protein VJN63_11970 [Thermoplasmata archaeon]|nr:hypothetical protein [Thermoplasmata archaeon]
MLVGIVLVVPFQYLASSDGDTQTFRLDGEFADWTDAGIIPYHAAETLGMARWALASYAMRSAGSKLLFWIGGTGDMLSESARTVVVHAFLDADGRADTGTPLLGVGAEYVASVPGGPDGAAEGLLSLFETTADGISAWRPVSRLSVGVSGGGVEIEVPKMHLDGYTSRALAAFAIDAGDGNESISAMAVGLALNALLLTIGEASPVVGLGLELATLRFGFEGSGHAEVDSLTLDVAGPATFEVRGLPLVLSSASPTGVLSLVSANASGARPGDVVTVRVVGVAASAPVTVPTREVSAYWGTPTTEKRIDGLFGDWVEDRVPWTGATPANPNVDLIAYGVAYESPQVYVYGEVAGTFLGGKRIPFWERVSRPSDGPSAKQHADWSPRTMDRGSMDDRLTVWLDRDGDFETGASLGGIGADVFIEVSGRLGHVTDVDSFLWDRGDWVPSDLPISVAIAGNRIEVGASVGIGARVAVAIEVTDWRGVGDRTAFPSAGTRGRVVNDVYPLPIVPWPPRQVDLYDPYRLWFLGWDPTEGLPDRATEVRLVMGRSLWGYLFVRIVLAETDPDLFSHTYWVYVDLNQVGFDGNDWLVEEKSGVRTLCSYQWDAAEGNWGVGGVGCDMTDTIRDSDLDGAVRVVDHCWPMYGCIDFAIRSDRYPGLGGNPHVSVAAEGTEDLLLDGSPDRNPSTGPSGCNVIQFDDCSVYMAVIPEFGGLLPLLLLAIAPAVILRPRCHRVTQQRARSSDRESARKKESHTQPF